MFDGFPFDGAEHTLNETNRPFRPSCVCSSFTYVVRKCGSSQHVEHDTAHTALCQENVTFGSSTRVSCLAPNAQARVTHFVGNNIFIFEWRSRAKRAYIHAQHTTQRTTTHNTHIITISVFFCACAVLCVHTYNMFAHCKRAQWQNGMLCIIHI